MREWHATSGVVVVKNLTDGAFEGSNGVCSLRRIKVFRKRSFHTKLRAGAARLSLVRVEVFIIVKLGKLV